MALFGTGAVTMHWPIRYRAPHIWDTFVKGISSSTVITTVTAMDGSCIQEQELRCSNIIELTLLLCRTHNSQT